MGLFKPDIKKMTAKKDVEGLIKALQHKDQPIRLDAAKALGAIGEARAVKPLVEAMKDEDGHVRGAAAKALREVRDAKAVKPLIEVLRAKHVHPAARESAIKALAKIGDNEAIEPLVEALQNEDGYTRLMAAEALDQPCWKPDELYKEIHLFVTSKEAPGRVSWRPRNDTEKAWYLMAKDEWDELVELGQPAVEPLIKALEDYEVWEKAVKALGEIGDAEATKPLVQLLESRGGYAREIAAAALDKLGWKPGNDTEKAFYLVTKHEWDALVALGLPAIKPLIGALVEEDTRQAATEALEEIGEPAVEPLIEALKYGELDSRYLVAWTLGYMGDARAVEPLIEALKDKDVIVRMSAASALGEIGDARAVEPLTEALKDEDKHVRETAAEALEQIEAEESQRPEIDEGLASGIHVSSVPKGRDEREKSEAGERHPQDSWGSRLHHGQIEPGGDRGVALMAQTWRTIRVFISSTFRDMQAEREELVKRVFPQLRKLCEQRGVTWGEVDLRWGISDEQKAEGKVLPICLEEIQNCRPYFIGLLGERYGWVPDEIPQDIIQREPWLAQHRDHSVTELEILHGVLNNPEMADHAFFYFRDPETSKRVEEEIAQKTDYEPETAESLEKLESLKKKIKESGLSVRFDYPDPRSLGELVLNDLTSVIDRLYPADSQPDPLDREAAEHEAFAASRARIYIQREEYFNRLDTHIDSSGPPLVMLGESGCGKSALLSNWVLRYREKIKSKGSRGRQPLLLMHFVGASPYSTDWAAMLRRIMGEFKRYFDIRDDIPDRPDELRAAFANWLNMAAARGRVILILDGLNQLEDRDSAPDLVWLPSQIPANIRLIMSTLPGRPLDNLKKRDWPTLSVEPLDETERQKLITEYLGLYRKSLNQAQLERIAGVSQTSNPLYLRVLLEELRVYGEHETVNKQIDHYLAAGTVSELYSKVLRRYEKDYERDRPGLVRDAMSLLWAARRGLSEAELLELLGSDGEPLPRAYWSPLYLAAESSLVSRSGLLGFGHDYLRQAVCGKFLATEKEQQAAHLRLAGYFDSQDLGPRKVDELPWQLGRARAWQRLYNLLAHPEFLTSAWGDNKFELKAYWVQVEENSSLRLVEAYQPVLEAPGRDMDLTWLVSTLLLDMGHPEEALKLRTHLLDHFRLTGNKAGLARSLNNQALILRAKGEMDAAMALYKEGEQICRDLDDKKGLASTLGGQAGILQSRGELDAAMALCKEEERICRELGNKDLLARSLIAQAIILYSRGELDAAMALLKEDERICHELGNKDLLARSLIAQAGILKRKGELDAAMALFKEEEKICRELGNKYVLVASLDNQALILQDKGELDAAMALYKEEEQIYRRELGNKDELAKSLIAQAGILKRKGELDAAMALHKEVEQIYRELGNKDELVVSLDNQALILQDKRELDAAMALYKEVERIYRESGNKQGLTRSLITQALILQDKGEMDAAMARHKEGERICRELGNKGELARSLIGQAFILQGSGELDAAMTLYKEVEQICRELDNKDVLEPCLNEQAIILQSRGELDAAMALYKEQEQICRELGNKQGLAISLINQASILVVNQPRSALSLVDEAYNLANDSGDVSLVQSIEAIRARIR